MCELFPASWLKIPQIVPGCFPGDWAILAPGMLGHRHCASNGIFY